MSLSGTQIMDNVPKAHKKEKVEGQLWVTLRLLAATEGNIHLFNSLKNKNLATNDVSNFIKKQTIHRKVDKREDFKLKKAAMHSKLVDALSFASRLRQRKKIQRNEVMKFYKERKTYGRKVIKDLVDKYRERRTIEIESANKKIMHLKEKYEACVVTKQAPEAASEILNGVNVFNVDWDELGNEPPEGPMVCDPSLSFDRDELSILARGPKFMVRGELVQEDFNVELEKMVFKQKYAEVSQSKDDCRPAANESGVDAHSAANIAG